MAEQGSKPWGAEPGTWRAGCLTATLPTQWLQAKFPSQIAISPCYQKKREGYILPAAGHVQNSLKKLGWFLPSLLLLKVCAGLQARIPMDATFMAKTTPNRQKSLGKSPLLRPPTPQASATGFCFWTRLRRDWPEKSVLKAKKRSQIKVSTLNLCSGLKV